VLLSVSYVPWLMFVINLNFCLLNLNICILALFASGVESFDVEMKEQKVTVKGNVTPDAVLQTVSKTGKKDFVLGV
jgi:hypothetical protein